MKRLKKEKDINETMEFDGIKNDDTKTNKKKDKVRASKFTRGFASVLSFMAFGFVTGVLVITIFVTSVVSFADPIDASLFERTGSTTILDADGNVIYELGAKLIDNIEYDDLSQSLVDAFVAVEDSRFFKHNGFDVPRFSNALIKNGLSSVASRSLSFDAGGASTIDMQLVKNVIFTKEDTATGENVLPEVSGVGGLKRKVSEIYYARKINTDQVLEKKLILQNYLNIINFGIGNNSLGVQKAAQYYFSKDVGELNIVESAFLAGVINAPNINTPYYKLSNATERTHQVLDLMEFHGYIDEEELRLAKSFPLENLFVEQQSTKSDAYPYQAYIDIVLSEVQELTGLNPATNSLIIKTAMDSGLQSQLDKIQNREIKGYNPREVDANTQIQLASTVLDNQTGEVIGTIGGFDYYGQRIVNRSYHSVYQPGSTIKAFISYAPAFEYLGYATSHVIHDEPYKWKGTDIELKNDTRQNYGDVTLSRALTSSYNIPAVKTFDAVQETIGLDRYKDYVESIGFKRYAQKLDEYFDAIGSDRKGRDALNSQFAIGGHDFYTNTQELAGAMAVMLNGGNYIKPHTIREVKVKDTGEVITSPYKKTPVLSEGAAYLTSQLLKDVVDMNRNGISQKWVAANFPVFAKTGTTDWSDDDSRELNVPAGYSKDKLFISATDRFSIASWSGFDPEHINKKDGTAYITGPLINYTLQAKVNGFIQDYLVNKHGPGKAINRPNSVKQIEHIIATFPYQSPIEGMDAKYITTGWIKSDFATLVPAEAPKLEAFQGAEVGLEQAFNQTNIKVLFSEYPNPDQLTLKRTGDSNLPLLFHPSWIFGPVKYKTDVYVNDQLVHTEASSEQEQSINIDLVPGNKVTACTYYGFESNENVHTHKECHDIDTNNLVIAVPDFRNKSLTEVQQFASGFNITVNSQYNGSYNLNDFGKVESINGIQMGSMANSSDLYDKTWNVILKDHTVNIGSYKDFGKLQNAYGAFISFEKLGESNVIDKVIDENGNQVSNFQLSSMLNRKLTVHTK